MPSICLNMIVKNESRIITRLLNSVIDIIDCYCICDTGSTDNTIELIETFFKEKGKTGKIVHEPFKNFSHNRNFALQSCIGMSDYILLLDADMVLEIKNFDKDELTGIDTFFILQGNDRFYYQNVRIIKNNELYKYVCVTHEYIDIPKNTLAKLIDKNKLFIRDLGDGGSKENKYQRDIRLLLDGLREEPNNSRYHFYLANSYYDISDFNEAIIHYKKRIELGGWKEEVWYSYYKIGLAYKNMGRIPDALYYWLEGYNFYPERLEAIYEIINYYRVNKKYKLCMKFYNIAKEILDKNENRENYLFLHNDIYTHKILFEYTIFASYNGIMSINDEVIKTLNSNTISLVEVDNVLSNMKFYKDVLTKKAVYKMDNKLNLTINGESIMLNSSSSCLIKNPNGLGYSMNLRYVNYNLEDNGDYTGCEKHIISINKCIEFNEQLIVIGEKWISTNFDNRLYIGIEDIKIYYDSYNNKLKYIGTGFHTNNKIGLVGGNYDTTLEINELKQNFNNSLCEKNWVYVDYNNELHVIYDWYPLKICKLYVENNSHEIKIVEFREMPRIFSKVRGSSCGFAYKKNYYGSCDTDTITLNINETEIWFIGHIVSHENPRHYYHIISVFNQDMNLLRYSAPFKFDGEAVEFSLSIVVEDTRVLINYSTWDRTSRIGVYDKKYIDSIVKYKPLNV